MAREHGVAGVALVEGVVAAVALGLEWRKVFRRALEGESLAVVRD